MALLAYNKYQARIELENFLQNQLDCEQYLNSTLDLPGFVKCKATSKIIEIVFNPPIEVNEEYIFQEIDALLKDIGIVFLRATIRQFVGNLARTAVASATGGALGSRAGPAGVLLGLLAGAAIEKALFDWKDICECTRDEYGNLSMIDLRGENNGNV